LIEREWREASDMRRSTVTLAVILAIAAVLRFWGLGSGIPHSVGVDEPEIMDRAVRMMKTGDFNPRFFDYPGLYIYLQLVVASLQFLAGATAGTWRSLTDAVPTDFYLWGRAVTATIGTATVLLVYLAGMRWGTRYALFAATLMAVLPHHVRESHYILTDVPVTFFIALAFVLTLRASEGQRAPAYAWAGAAVGLAAGTSYAGGLALVLPLLAVWMSPGLKPSRLVAAMAAVGASAAAFLVAAPYTVLDLPAFLEGYANRAAGSGQPAGSGWSIAMTHLRIGLQWPALLAVSGGVVLAIVRAFKGSGRVRWTLAVVFPLLYFVFVANQSLIPGRSLLPLTPFLCVLAAAAVVSGVSLLRRYQIPRRARTALIAGLTIAALLPPAIVSIGVNRTISKVGTLDLAYRWIREHLPAGSTIVIESRALRLPDDSHRSSNVVQLREQDYEHYRSHGVDFIVASSQCYGPYFRNPQQHPNEYAEYKRLFDQSEELIRFVPTAEHPGPELRVFKVGGGQFP